VIDADGAEFCGESENVAVYDVDVNTFDSVDALSSTLYVLLNLNVVVFLTITLVPLNHILIFFVLSG
jgi:hypothetical protein